MEPAAFVTSSHDGKTDPPPPTIGLGENVEPPPLTPGTAAALADALKKELEVANEHLKSVNKTLYELVQAVEDEKNLLSAEVNRLRADKEKMKEDKEKMKEFVVRVEKEQGKLLKYAGDGKREFYPEE